MTSSERLEAFLSKAASSTMELISIPPVNHAAIARRAQHSKAVRPPMGKWLAIGTVAAALVVVLFLPPVKNALARAAHTFLTMTYFPSSHKNEASVLGRAVTLEQVRAITAFRFIEPRGLPAGYQLVAAAKAPAGAARAAVTLRYASPTNPIGLAMFESAARPHRKQTSCKVLRWAPSRGHAFPPLPKRRSGASPPPGFKSIPCHAWETRGTQIQLIDMRSALTPSQIAHVIQLTH